jgi:hypothetical protein
VRYEGVDSFGCEIGSVMAGGCPRQGFSYPLRERFSTIGVLCKKAQLSFFDPFQYRYVSSTDVFFGGISLFDIGYYYGYPAAIVSTWTGEQEGIVILEASEFVHVLTNPEGALFTVTYRMTDAPCL